MPQPLSRVKADATVIVSPIVVERVDPKILQWTSLIVALSSEIDLELSLLLVRILGGDAEPSLAMYDALQADNVKLKALDAAAKSSLTADQYKVFEAIIKLTRQAQKPRHKIAHWVWAYSPELPDALLLADPKHLREQEIGRSRLSVRIDLVRALKGTLPSDDEIDRFFAPPSSEHILVYRESDFESAIGDLIDTSTALFCFQHYLKPIVANALLTASETNPLPVWIDLQTSEGSLRRLLTLRLFREAFLPVGDQKDPSNNPQRTPE